jgi:hypothetical protein
MIDPIMDLCKLPDIIKYVRLMAEDIAKWSYAIIFHINFRYTILDIRVVGDERAGYRHWVAAAQKVSRRTLDPTQMIKRQVGAYS